MTSTGFGQFVEPTPLANGEADRRYYASSREVAWRVMAITTREGATAPETKRRGGLDSKRISKMVTATEDNAQKVSARVDTVQKVIPQEEGEMETEISEVLEILRRPLPSDSVLKFIVSEDGYKRIIEDREKSNQKYRVCVMVIDSMVAESVRVMRNAGVSDDVISRVQKAGHLRSSSHSRGSRKIALEVGFSQSYPSLHRATLWWIEQKKATVAVLLCLTEVDKSSGEVRREFGTTEELDAEIEAIGREFYRQRREHPRILAPLEYNGYKWFGRLSDAFFETYRETDSGVLKSEPVYLVKDGVDVTDAIPTDLTVTVGDFVPHGWVSDDHVRRIAVNFLHSQTFMEGLSNAMVETAINRVEDAFEVREE
ncbi:hypothetical protein V1525DRAFT_444409 [Lipomyces kononenkoae]|uniref:Uncharacterized protein n=1 Tax=Lipomyces kononenkoae TaxID=34357 RepID=A0ACC3SXT6_LIPKO